MNFGNGYPYAVKFTQCRCSLSNRCWDLITALVGLVEGCPFQGWTHFDSGRRGCL